MFLRESHILLLRGTFSACLHAPHLEIAFLIVGIDFKGLVFRGALFIECILQSPEQSAEKVIAQGYLLSWFQQDFFSLKVEDAEGFIVNERMVIALSSPIMGSFTLLMMVSI